MDHRHTRQFYCDPRRISYLEIDSEIDDTKRLMMRPIYGNTDRFIEGRSHRVLGAGMEGRLPLTGGRVAHFVSDEKATMTSYYFDKVTLAWRKSIYHFPAGTVFPNAAAITYNSNSAWLNYKSYHRFPYEETKVVTICRRS